MRLHSPRAVVVKFFYAVVVDATMVCTGGLVEVASVIVPAVAVAVHKVVCNWCIIVI